MACLFALQDVEKRRAAKSAGTVGFPWRIFAWFFSGISRVMIPDLA